MTVGSNNVHLTKAQQKLTQYRTALLKEKWRNLIIRIRDSQNRQSIRLGLTNEIRETNSTKKSLQELNAKLLAQLRENQAVVNDKQELRKVAAELLLIQRELEENNVEMQRQKAHIAQFQANSFATQQELEQLRKDKEGVNVHLHVNDGYISAIFFIPESNTFVSSAKSITSQVQSRSTQTLVVSAVPVQQSSTMENILIPIVCLTKQFGKVFQTCPVKQTQLVSGVLGSYLGFEATASLNGIPLKYRPLAYTLSKAKKVSKSLCNKVRQKPDSTLPTELLPPHHAAAAEYSSSISVNSESSVNTNTQALVAHVHGFNLQ